MLFICFDENTLEITNITQDIPDNGAYIPWDSEVINKDLLLVKLDRYELPYAYVSGKLINGSIIPDYSEYWQILKGQCMQLLQESSYLLDNMLYVTAENRIQWLDYRTQLKDIINKDITENPYAFNLPNIPTHIPATDRELKKIEARYEIEKLVGDIPDLLTDQANTINLLERLCLRLFLHVTGTQPLAEEYLTKYTYMCQTYIGLVDSGQLVDQGDLGNDAELFEKLLTRKMQIGQIIKEKLYS